MLKAMLVAFVLFVPLTPSKEAGEWIDDIRHDGQLDAVIAELVVSGEICSRYGHRFGDWTQDPHTWHKHRVCDLCRYRESVPE